MKFPKLKNGLCCRILAYLPALSLFPYIFIFACFEGFSATIGGIAFVGLLAVCALGLWYLLSNFILFFTMEGVLAEVSTWKRARKEFPLPKKLHDRSTAEEILHKRLKRWGKTEEPLTSMGGLVHVAYRRRYSCMSYYASIEQIAMLYSVPCLDATLHTQILASAMRHFSKLNRRPRFFIDRHKKKAPMARGCAVIILADQVTDEVYKKLQSEKGRIVCCVCSGGRCVYQSKPELHIVGMTQMPERNYTLKVVKKLVFCGRLPLRNNPHVLHFEYADNISPDTSFWSFLGWTRNVQREVKGENRKEKRYIKKMPEEEVRLWDDSVYFKRKGFTSEFIAMPDEEDPKLLHVEAERYWSYPRRRKMKNTDYQDLLQKIERSLSSQGYRIQWDTNKE